MRLRCLLPTLLLLLPAHAQHAGEEATRQALSRLGAQFYEQSRVELLPTAEEKYQTLLADIGQAREYIHLDYFKFQDDSICHRLFELLSRKAAEGVEVRVIFDAVGNRYSDSPLSKQYIKDVRARGIKIFAFDPVRFPWVHHFVHRNHHKIAVIDGRLAYTGGMNVADYYLHGKPHIGQWRDMHVRLTGPAVSGLEHVFEVMWYDVSGEMLNLLPTTESRENGNIALVSRMPRCHSDNMRRAIAAAIDNAENVVQIVNPYTTLTHTVRRALYRALKRGVRLQVMVSYNGDATITQNVQAIEMHKLMKRGAEVYYYEGGFHHSKVMTIDNEFCCVGTTNLDGRSLRNDYEVSLFVFDKETTQRLQEIFHRDVREHCFMLTPALWHQRFSTGQRFSGRFFTPIRSNL